MATSTEDRRRSEYKFVVCHEQSQTDHTRGLGAKNRYISKIIFTSILGYPVDIGHMEAVNLISSPKYSEKQIVRLYPLID